MTNKEIKKLVENLESTLVSMQNDRNRDSFNLKLKSDKISMLEAKLELKSELLLNRNKQVRDLSDKIQRLEREIETKSKQIENFTESVSNLEFLLDKKDREISVLQDLKTVNSKEISSLKNQIIDFEEAEGFIRNILDNPSLTDMETVTEIRKIF